MVDCGDVPVTWLDNEVALAQMEAGHRVVGGRGGAASGNGIRVEGGSGEEEYGDGYGDGDRKGKKERGPRIVALGGDHTTTLPALRAAHERFGRMSVLHFDSHLDSWDPEVLGGVSGYAGVNHGTFLHVAAGEGLLVNGSNVHVGVCVLLPSLDLV